MHLIKVLQASKLVQGLAAGVVGTLVAFLLFFPGWLDRPATPKIRLILLDQNSLDWAKDENGLSWPWPREVYSTIVQFCQRTGVRSLAFDVLFTEPSKYGVADDQAFAAAIGGYKHFVGAVFLSRTAGSEKSWPPFAPAPVSRIQGLDAWLAESGHGPFPRASFPVPEISSASGILANVHLDPDVDAVYRRTAMFEVFDGKVLPSLALASYLTAQPSTPLQISPGRFMVGDGEIPVDSRGKAVLNFRGPSGTHKAYNAAAVIQSELRLQGGEKPVIENLEDFKDAYVFFGFSAPGLFDLRPTPISGVYPGVEISATMLDNLLANDFIRPVPTAPVLALTLLMALLAGMATSWAAGISRSALVYVFFICAPVILCVIAYRLGFWMPLMVQEAGVVVTLFSSGLIYYTTEGRQKKFIKGAFKQYLSHAVIEQIIAHPERLKLGGERRMLSIFFSDLEGFTTISEGLDPEALTNLLNVYLSAMTDIIQEEGGTVDKFEGDAIIAFWNAPIEQPDHAVRCVRSALRCQAKLAEMRPGFKKSMGKDLKMRIGINTGSAVVGNMGSHSRFDYTMIGDAVNLAARLEGINKQFGTYTMISQTSMDQMSGAFPVREISRVAVVGRSEPVVVYEPYLPESIDERIQSVITRFSEAVALFYQGEFAQAEAVFSSLAEEDAPSRFYVAKCRELIENPPDQWQGVWVITSK
ncbi:MAG: adenylate/guanylate cyclase domain-containing protein [Deltaproteobacteria bacterium HGW-Deltaproteobacteria-19]|nr:MAG: adenylate/guanylate cyclase domain-containing protein [Deltaproteobacteria bacterium HGW-Deltaproteobacteria-19]